MVGMDHDDNSHDGGDTSNDFQTFLEDFQVKADTLVVFFKQLVLACQQEGDK